LIQLKNHRLKDAIRLKNYNADNSWIVLGQSSAWPNDSSPPAELLSASDVPNKFGAVKAILRWAVEDDAGTILYNDGSTVRKFLEIDTEEEVLAEDPANIKVIATATIHSNELAVSAYRAFGISTDLVPADGYEEDNFVASANIDEWGTVECLHHAKPTNINPDTSWELSIIFEY